MIWKFVVPVIGHIEMPRGAQVLGVQIQHEMTVLWAIVDPDAPTMKRAAKMVGTGAEFPFGTLRDLEYVGTLQVGVIVFHVFLGPEEAI